MSSYDLARVQVRSLPLHISKELCSKRTYIVTGANVGLGLEAARHLVAAGASKVIMAVRNAEAGEAAKRNIETSTKIEGVAEVWHLDLSSYASVKSFAAKANEELGRIEAVIENAGVASAGPRAEGHHLCLTVNVVGTFLLAVLLLPKLRADAVEYGYSPRLTVISSGTAFDVGDLWAKVAGDPIARMDADAEIGMAIYPMSKLMEILAVREMARLLPLSRGQVIVNSVNPGLCETDLARNAPAARQEEIRKLRDESGRTAECGSRTLLAAAVAGEDSHGSYMDDCFPANNLLPEWIDAEADKQSWQSIAKELEKIEPGCVARALE